MFVLIKIALLAHRAMRSGYDIYVKGPKLTKLRDTAIVTALLLTRGRDRLPLQLTPLPIS